MSTSHIKKPWETKYHGHQMGGWTEHISKKKHARSGDSALSSTPVYVFLKLSFYLSLLHPLPCFGISGRALFAPISMKSSSCVKR